MDNEQNAKLASYQRVQAFDTEYAEDTTRIEDYNTLKTNFDDLVNQINTAAREQQVTEGVTADLLDSTKLTMANTVIEFASRGVVKADIAGNEILSNSLDEPVSYIFKAAKNEAVQRAQDLRNTMNVNLAVLTNITPENIATIDRTISDYTAIMNAPIINIQHKKSQGTDPLPGFFKHADKLLDNMFRLVKSYYYRTKPGMVDEMALAMQIINTGIRHTLVNITVLSAENDAPIEGATATDSSNGKVYLSDYTGLVHIDTHKSGHDSFVIAAAGRTSVTVGMDIKRGTDNKLMVKLVRVG